MTFKMISPNAHIIILKKKIVIKVELIEQEN